MLIVLYLQSIYRTTSNQSPMVEFDDEIEIDSGRVNFGKFAFKRTFQHTPF